MEVVLFRLLLFDLSFILNLFSKSKPDESGQTAHFALEHHLVGRHSQLDAAITPMLPSSIQSRMNSTNRKRYLAVACQDRRLRIYNVVTARPVRCYRGSYTEDGFLVRCSIDPTGSLIATSGKFFQEHVRLN